MPFEFMVLVGAVVLGLVQVFAAAHLATKARGVDWNLSPRDMVMPPLPPLAARFERIVHNYLETFAFFVAAIVMVVVAGKHSMLTVIGSSLYLGARVLYVVAYAKAIRGVRSALWISSVVGILMLLVALFL